MPSADWLSFLFFFVMRFRSGVLFKSRNTDLKWTLGKMRHIMLTTWCAFGSILLCACVCVCECAGECACARTRSYWVRLGSKYKETGSILLKGLWTNFTLRNMTLGKSTLSHSVYGKDIMADTFAKVRRKIMQRQHMCQFMSGWHQQRCLGSYVEYKI